MKTISVDNITFKSVKAAYTYFGIDGRTFYLRKKEKWPLDEAFGLVPRKHKGIVVNINNLEFSSIDAASRHFGLKLITVHKRIKAGWSLEEAFELKKHKRIIIAKPVTVEGKKYKSIKKASKAYNLCPFLVRGRLRHCWSIDEAFELVKRNTHTVNGKVYAITNCKNSKMYVGVTCNTLERRFNQHVVYALRHTSSNKLSKAIRKYGAEVFTITLLDTTDSIIKLAKLERKYIKMHNSRRKGYNTSKSRYNKSNVKSITYDGVKYSRHELAARFNLSLDTLRYRLKANLPLERKHIGKAKPITFMGRTFASICALARELGMHHNSVDYRYKNGTLASYVNPAVFSAWRTQVHEA